MKKNSTVTTKRNEIFKEAKLTIGLDLGDRAGRSAAMLKVSPNPSQFPRTCNGLGCCLQKRLKSGSTESVRPGKKLAC
jgi:hypothetical protein